MKINTIELENIPLELKNNALFCTWRLTDRGGRMAKLPYNPLTGSLARSDNPNTFNNYSTTVKYLPQYYGINAENEITGGLGLGLFNGFSAIDIDNCIDPKGNLTELATDIIEFMDSYTEKSPSGRGIRIIFKTNVMIDTETHYMKNSNNGLEIYISDNTKRYVTLTGNVYKNARINDIDITSILDKYMRKSAPKRMVAPINTTTILDSDEKINRALENNPNFNKAWNRTATGSDGTENEDDLSLLNLLARVLNGDHALINNAFMRSPYYATKDQAHIEKWEVRTDYRVDSIQKAIYSYAMDRKNFNEHFGLNDTGNALIFVENYKGKIHYNIDNKVWMLWNGKYWQPDSFGMMKTYAEIVIEQMRNEVLDEPYEHVRKKMISNINRISNTHGKEAMIKESQHLPNIPITNGMFNTQYHLINTASGIIDLKTGLVSPHDKDAKLSKYIGVEISDKEPKAWLKFLKETYADNLELVDYVQRLTGYWLTGLTSEQSLYIFLGDGSNGKSLLLETVLAILGDYGTTSSADLLVDKVFNNNTEQKLAALSGSRFVMVEETESNDRLKESTIKNMTSDYGEITARFLYGNEFTFKPEFKLIMATNHKPIIRGTDHGIWRRIKIIPHNIIVADKDQDKMLGFKLKAELPEILNWAVQGAVEYFKNGLQEPKIVSEQVKEYRNESDIVERWLIDNCDRDAGHSASVADLFKDITKYIEDNKEFKLSNQMFGRNMSKKFEPARLNGKRSYIGVRIKEKTLIEKLAEVKEAKEV